MVGRSDVVRFERNLIGGASSLCLHSAYWVITGLHCWMISALLHCWMISVLLHYCLISDQHQRPLQLQTNVMQFDIKMRHSAMLEHQGQLQHIALK